MTRLTSRPMAGSRLANNTRRVTTTARSTHHDSSDRPHPQRSPPTPDATRTKSPLILSESVDRGLEQASAHAQIPMQESVLDRYLRHLGDHVEAI